jgi:hypothetical protein
MKAEDIVTFDDVLICCYVQERIEHTVAMEVSTPLSFTGVMFLVIYACVVNLRLPWAKVIDGKCGLLDNRR